MRANHTLVRTELADNKILPGKIEDIYELISEIKEPQTHQLLKVKPT